jgi:hypothetical protein
MDIMPLNQGREASRLGGSSSAALDGGCGVVSRAASLMAGVLNLSSQA